MLTNHLPALLQMVVLFFLLPSCHSPTPDAPVKEPPNIVLILVDDLGLNDLSAYGSTFYETPNIDYLVANGVKFKQAYAASRVCSPSRASIMTGQFTARHGITDWIGARYGEAWRNNNRHDKMLPATYVHQLPQLDYTLAEALRDNGYDTFFAGKWHLGGIGNYPEDHGFNHNYGGWEKGSPIGGFFAPFENPKLPQLPPGKQLSAALAEATSEYIIERQDTSFFAMLSFYAVHAPIQTSETNWKKYRDKAISNNPTQAGFKMERILPIRTQQDNPVYAGLVADMDRAVGMVLHTLDSLDLMNNTIIVFTSDNGGVASGDNYATAPLEVRGGKGYQWEGGIRVPLIIKAPGLPAGVSTNETAIGTDIYPTCMALADLPLLPDQHRDGINLLPALMGSGLPDRYLYWHYPHYGNQGGEPASIIQFKQFKLIHYWERNEQALYYLPTDPFEQEDLANQEATTSEYFKNELFRWLAEVDAEIPKPDSQYDSLARQQYLLRQATLTLDRLEVQRDAMFQPDYQPNENWWGSQQ